MAKRPKKLLTITVFDGEERTPATVNVSIYQSPDPVKRAALKTLFAGAFALCRDLKVPVMSLMGLSDLAWLEKEAGEERVRRYAEQPANPDAVATAGTTERA